MKTSIIIVLSLIYISVWGQVGVNTETPDPSAELHIYSTQKGVILPVLTDAEMKAIVAPATGLIVYNSTENAYYYFNGSIWAMIGTVGKSLVDADADTEIKVEETSDEDVIRLDIGNNSGAQYENKVVINNTETVIDGDYIIPDGHSLKIGSAPFSLPSAVGNKGNVLATDGAGNWTWQEAHGGLGIANGVQTMYFSETTATEAINSDTYYTPVFPFSTMTVDSLEVYLGALAGTPNIKFAIYDSNGNVLASSVGSSPASAGVFEDGLTSTVTLESANLYYFAVTDLNNTATTILVNTKANNPLNKSDITSTLSAPTMGSPGPAGKSVWMVAH